MNNKFNLSDYADEIRSVATSNMVSVNRGLDMFVTNLTTMSDHYSGAPGLNFRTLGQQWNRLTSSERNDQKAAVLKVVAQRSRRRETTEN